MRGNETIPQIRQDDLIPIGTIVDNYEIMECIGSGSFSHVYIAKHIPTSNYCAAKVVNLKNITGNSLTNTLRELSVFMQVSHPSICHLYSYSLFQDNLIFFIEYATGGTLLDYVIQRQGLGEHDAQILFIQIFDAIRYLHIYHFAVHRDLKLENILLDSKNNIKIIDFGLTGTFYNNTLRTFVGTAGYQSPEIIAGNEYNEKCDVWSLGVCLFAMVTGRLPFSTQSSNYRKLIQEATDLKYPSTFSPGLVDLLQKMLEVHPSSRCSLVQLQSHPWLHGLDPIGNNIAPKPIIFYKINGFSDILKYKRRPTKADETALKKCEELNIDRNSLIDDLQKGITNSNTITYFFMVHPLLEKPTIYNDCHSAHEVVQIVNRNKLPHIHKVSHVCKGHNIKKNFSPCKAPNPLLPPHPRNRTPSVLCSKGVLTKPSMPGRKKSFS
ncbi:CAMK family protein kinase [Histomonas meleagridis]|uniref:CAMK family protein kinase n=1 Tax=Histomonas meleagridis TaxID=135588 RepID=UPI00355A3947|nr:CAMK family protein kinase [Histomonas meleagridis]KAH0797640.1 CAMK family protein kinase [Histomonas meleagridis]